jgi:hypothetical protein
MIEVCSKIHIRLCRGHTGMYRQIVLQLPNIKHRRIRPGVLKLLRGGGGGAEQMERAFGIVAF